VLPSSPCFCAGGVRKLDAEIASTRHAHANLAIFEGCRVCGRAIWCGSERERCRMRPAGARPGARHPRRSRGCVHRHQSGPGIPRHRRRAIDDPIAVHAASAQPPLTRQHANRLSPGRAHCPPMSVSRTSPLALSICRLPESCSLHRSRLRGRHAPRRLRHPQIAADSLDSSFPPVPYADLPRILRCAAMPPLQRGRPRARLDRDAAHPWVQGANRHGRSDAQVGSKPLDP